MLRILRADPISRKDDGRFHLRRVRPGAILGRDADPAFGSLSIIDHANLDRGAIVHMHEHKDDEILSYVWRGTMVHEDSTGDPSRSLRAG